MAAGVDYSFAYYATTNLIANYQYKAEKLLEAAQRGLLEGHEVRSRGVLLEIDEKTEEYSQTNISAQT